MTSAVSVALLASNLAVHVGSWWPRTVVIVLNIKPLHCAFIYLPAVSACVHSHVAASQAAELQIQLLPDRASKLKCDQI